MKKRWRRRIALVLSVLMMVSYIPVSSYGAVQAVTDDNGAAAVEQQVQDQANAEGTEVPPAEEAQGDAEVQPAAAAFSESVKVDGVIVTVKAAEGVFPAGSSLQVKKVSVPKAVDTDNAAGAYAFDITILDRDGNEIQPNGEAQVSFKTDEVSEFDTNVFHMNGKKAEALEVTEKGKTATVEATGFSTYVLTFYNTADQAVYTMAKGQTINMSELYELTKPATEYGLYNIYSSNTDKIEIVNRLVQVKDGATLVNGETVTLGVTYYTNSAQTAINTYDVTVKITDLDEEGEIVAPQKIGGLIYTGSAQTLVKAGKSSAGTMEYQLNSGTWNTDPATMVGTDAGTYTINWRIVGSNGDVFHEGAPVTVKIAEATATAPKVASGLVYNGSNQKLITEAATTNVPTDVGRLQYAVKHAGAGEPSITSGSWVENFTDVTEKDATDFYVWYRVIKGSKDNPTVLVEPAYVPVTIAKADCPADIKAATGLVYNDGADLCTATGVAAYTGNYAIKYSVDNGEYAASIPTNTGLSVGTHHVTWKAPEVPYCYKAGEGSFDVVIAKVDVTAPEVAEGLVYNVSEQELITKAGTTSAGKMLYAVTAAGKQAPTEYWVDNYKEITEEGPADYYVWYKVVSENGTVLAEPAYIPVTIGPAEAGEVEPLEVAEGLVYNGDDLNLIEKPASVENGTVYYTLTEDYNVPSTSASGIWEKDYTAIVESEAGDYVVWFAAKLGNQIVVAPTPTPVSIAKAENPVVFLAGTDLVYNDEKPLLYLDPSVDADEELLEQFDVKFVVDDESSYKNLVPVNKGLEAGLHTVTYTVTPKEDIEGNYETATGTCLVFVAKKQIVVNEPVAKTLQYTAADQELVKAGSASDNMHYMYRLEDGAWTSDVTTIKGTEAGVYTVKYKVVDASDKDLDDANYKFVDEDGEAVDRVGYCYPEIEMVVDDLVVQAKDMTYGDDGTTKNVESKILGGVLSEDEWDITYYYAKAGDTKWEEWGPDYTTPAGDYQIKAVVKDPFGEVTFSTSPTNTFTIEQKEATIRVFDDWMGYGNTYDVTTDPVCDVDGLTPEDEANIENVLNVRFSVTRPSGQPAGAQPWRIGTYSIVPEATKVGAAFDNYNFVPVSGNLYVTEASENEIDLELQDYVYGDTIQKPVATADYGTPTIEWIAYEDYNNSRLDRWTEWSNRPGYKPVNAGTYIVRATVAGTTNYPAGEVMDTFTISKKPAIITIKDNTSVYDGNVVPIEDAAKVTVTGAVNGEEILYELSSDPAVIQEVGSYTMTAEPADNDVNKNYLIVVIDGIYTVSEAGTMTAKVEYINTDGKTDGHCVFNGARHGVKVTPVADGKEILPPDARVYYSLEPLDSPEGGVTNPDLVSQIHAGKYTIWYYIEAKDYAPVKGSAVLDIDKAYLVLQVQDNEVEYGTRLDYQDTNFDEALQKEYIKINAYKDRAQTTELPFIEESVEGLNEFQFFMKDYEGQMTDIGQYEITTSKLTSDDYVIRYDSGILTINQKPVTFEWSHNDYYQFLYDGKEHGITATVFTDDLVGKDKQEGKVEIVYEDTNKYPNSAVDVKRTDDWSVGFYTAKIRRLTGERAHNYKIDWEDAAKTYESHFMIVPVDLYLTPNDVEVIYGEKAVDNGYTATGLVNDEQAEDILLGTPVKYEFVDYEKGSDVGTYDIRITNVEDPNTTESLHAQNYTVKAEVNEDGLTVLPRPITLVWSTPNTFEYDGQYHEVKIDKVENDFDGNSAIDPEPTYTDNKKVDAGKYTAVAKLSEQDAKNYEILDNSDHYDWTITKRPATIYANSNTIVYGQAPADKGYYVDKKPLVENVETGKLDSIGEVSFKYNYKKNGKPGTYKITPVVTYLNPNYYIAGTVDGTLTVNYKQKVLLAQGKVSGNNGIRMVWNSISGAASYDVYFSKCSTSKKTYKAKKIANVKATNYRVGGLKAHKCYKFYIVAKDAKGKTISKSLKAHVCTAKYSGKYTNAKSIKVSKKSVSIARGGTYKIKSTVKKELKKKELLDQGHDPLLRYTSGNTAVATVSSAGVITGVSQGWCKVYVQTVNGLYQEIQVTVK